MAIIVVPPYTPPVANTTVLNGAGTGATTGYLPTSTNPERYMAQLLTATGGAAASITIDGSNDGVTSAGQIATWSLDTTGIQCLTPPIKPPYSYIRFTVVSAGTGTVQIGRYA